VVLNNRPCQVAVPQRPLHRELLLVSVVDSALCVVGLLVQVVQSGQGCRIEHEMAASLMPRMHPSCSLHALECVCL
jgi:hypothetical protein